MPQSSAESGDGYSPDIKVTRRDIQPLERPEANRPFVDRETELGLIKKKLAGEALYGKPVRAGLVCFWGAFGMGKSWLLKELERYFTYPWVPENPLDEAGNPPPPGKECTHPAATARLDLSRDKSVTLWTDDGFNLERLILELWQQLARQLGKQGPPDLAASLEERTRLCVEQISTWAVEICTPILLLDTMDHLIEGDRSAFAWLETHLIEPLAITDRVIFVFSSRGVIKDWGPFQVRRRIHTYKLGGFDERLAGQVLQAGETAGRFLVQHTYGHPFATERLGSLLQNRLNLDLSRVEQVVSPQSSAMLKEILGKIVQEALVGISNDRLREKMQAISILRTVSIENARWLLTETKLEEEERGDGYYLDEVIGVMQSNHLLYWTSARNCYVMDPILRRLMAHSLEINNPVLFEDAHRAAYGFYAHNWSKYPDNSAENLPELAFHLGWLLKLAAPTAAWEQFLSWWRAFPLPAALAGSPRWPESIAALKNDEEIGPNLTNDFCAALEAKSVQYSKHTKGE